MRRQTMLQKGEKDIAGREQKLDTQHQPQQGRRFLSPMAQMDRMIDEVFRRPLLSSLWSQRMGGGSGMEDLYLPVDMYEDSESVVLKAEIPGIKKENLDIQLTADSITISGRKSSEEKVEQKDFFRLERSFGSFTRKFPLPVETMIEKARASFKDGVLEVRIPKSAAAAQPVRKLTID
jgi:HSP20 family protein